MPVSSRPRNKLRKNLGDATISALAHKLCEMMEVRPPRTVGSLEEYRDEMVEARRAALSNPYLHYLDNGQTGVGKTHADAIIVTQLSKQGRMSLTLVPTHKDCAAVVTKRAEQGVDSVAFPHLNDATCLRYDEAKEVMALGISAVAALCPDCPCADSCGFQSQYQEAKATAHTVATQARGGVAMVQLTKGREYISIHENPLDMLRPNYVAERGLGVVELIARQAVYEASDPLVRSFCRRLEAIAKELDGWHHGSNETCEVPLPTPAAEREPRDLHRTLYAAVAGLGLVGKGPPPEAVRLVLAAALGKLSFIGVAVNEHPTKNGGVKIVRTIIGVGRNELPAGATVIINDATADPDELRAVLDRPVHTITPRGTLPQRHPVLQIIPRTDVTRRRSVAAVADILRGVLHDLPYNRIGLLTHRTLCRKVPDKLGEGYQERLSLVSYFGSGLSRGSNEWIVQCDALIVLGTPRVGTDAIRRHLMLLGKMDAARLTAAEARWCRRYWVGFSQSGRIRAVSTGRYTADADWRAAYRSIVRGELIQAIGRGRGILHEGIPVFVVSTEQIHDRATQTLGDIRIADAPFAPLTIVQARALSALRGTDGEGKERTLKSETVGRCIGVKKDRAYEILHKLEQDGRVTRRGERGGWYLPPRE